MKAAGAGSQWSQGNHPGCAGSQEKQWLGGFCAALEHQWALAGDSPKGTVKIARGGWDVTSAGKPEGMVKDTEEMQCILQHGAPEEGEGSLSPCQVGQDVMDLNCSLREDKDTFVNFLRYSLTLPHLPSPLLIACKPGLVQHLFQ